MNLGRVLTAVLLFKGLIIEWVIVRGFRENTGKASPDVWTESSYQVSIQVTFKRSKNNSWYGSSGNAHHKSLGVSIMYVRLTSCPHEFRLDCFENEKMLHAEMQLMRNKKIL